jgi:cysteine desulfurase/selenocysteine lyase
MPTSTTTSSSPSGPAAPARGSAVTGELDPDRLRDDFPLLTRPRPDGRRLVYLDSASSSQRPRSVLDAMDWYYETTHANVHRGVYAIAEEATRQFEAARAKIGRFVGAPEPAREIVFTKNATEALNLVAQSYGRRILPPGKAVLLTEMEHHANFVPWLMVAEERGTELRYLPIDDSYHLDLTHLEELVDGAGVVAVSAMSNVLGTVNDLRPIVEAAHGAGAVVVVDASQLVPHRVVDFSALGADFVAFTGHKMLGPTGIGVLWGRQELLDAIPPFLGGGEMIKDVRLDGFTPNDLPWKFEAGTPPIAEAIGLGAAVDYLEAVGLEEIAAHERALTYRAIEALQDRHGDDLTIYGPPAADPNRGGVLSLGYRGIHPHDLAQVLDSKGVCVRAGHHCAKPLMRRLGVSATARASLYLYNNDDDVTALSDALAKAGELFG